ncbi:polysaccharide deacetylase family protein [Planosporangium flavigriseum]|uniref:polysaccharide deacetylase family protein n=1 Tax=Planosporangium flavigriseum TaxID=373681 RepID=UPI0014395D05|nr:polysaccharide deacetylase family protein [Planosporangium flavigriseum]NJC67571.1 polysaccharide deacetylase family protein [Planosporangium flavigriseum]
MWSDRSGTGFDRPDRPIRRRALLLAATAAAGATAIAGRRRDEPAARWVNPPASPPSRPQASGSHDSAGHDHPPDDGVTHGPPDTPALALTFHGDGAEAQARTLLGELERGGARVTVLAVGSWLSAYPRMAARILDGGHELGNHTQHHLAIADLGAADVHAEIDGCAAVLKGLTGSIGRWFRPSATQYANDTIRAEAARVGYPVCLSYDVDALDFTDPDPAAVVRAVIEAAGNGSIVSMHFGHAATVAAIPELLDRLRQRGLRAVTMTELMR